MLHDLIRGIHHENDAVHTLSLQELPIHGRIHYHRVNSQFPEMSSTFTLREEISSVRQYLNREMLPLNGKVKNEFYMDPEVDEGIPIPRNLIRVFVEDVIRNGIQNEHPEATISISLQKSTLGILIMIADSGFRNGNGDSIGQHQSEGLRILSSYLPVFNRKHHVSISYKVLKLTSENGSPGNRVMITIKNQ